ncbi:WS/DGAT/MGAT family O-acyltransferase [Rhabdothermincola salaria]|uniref:WS/DGAT/MGAT family O-acyltransferase n=1 Tax=Rhabdothermincola salaria TaxID=2903142 RepID=UPI001E50BA1A|nr:wax ester/triacylglycerol synthase family O-acyltransferase [Rhabdothermincola salaria]MCD9625030.1 wax ester/triacylglycerol synthase family O-acyltransferase [Rhabdothermincola salaria]
MPQRLSGLDAAFLYFETRSMPMNVAFTAVLDPSTVPGGYSFEEMRSHIAARVPLVPKLRRKVVDVPFRIHHPVWVDDADYRPEHHIHLARLDPPGDERALADFVADLVSRPLDRRRPLWEFWVVEGLEGGHIALAGKVHHCVVDGVSGADLMPAFFGLAPEPEPIEPPQTPSATLPGELELLGWSIADRVRGTVAGIGALGRVGWATDAIRRLRLEGEPAGGTPMTAPPTPYNGAITAGRSMAFGRLPLDGVKEIRQATGAKLNDVVLTITAGALRAHLLDLDALPDQPLVAAVPVSVRREDQFGDLNNMVAVMFEPLRTEVADPRRRLELTTADSAAAKREQQIVGKSTLVQLTEMVDPLTTGMVWDLYSRAGMADRHRPAVNAVVSNVPGPPVPIYLGGAKALRLYPMGPVAESMGLNLTVMSYDGHLDIGLLTASALVPDAWEVVEHVEAAYAALRQAVGLA